MQKELYYIFFRKSNKLVSIFLDHLTRGDPQPEKFYGNNDTGFSWNHTERGRTKGHYEFANLPQVCKSNEFLIHLKCNLIVAKQCTACNQL